MGKHRQYKIPETPRPRDPYAPMNDTERKWINQVINGKQPAETPVEKPIECPAEYESYYDATAERQTRRLEQQKAFLWPKLDGLSEAIFQLTKNGADIPKALWKAHSDYLQAFAGIEVRLHTLRYIGSDAHIVQEVADA